MMGVSLFFLFAAFVEAVIGRWDWFVADILLSLLALWQEYIKKERGDARG